MWVVCFVIDCFINGLMVWVFIGFVLIVLLCSIWVFFIGNYVGLCCDMLLVELVLFVGWVLLMVVMGCMVWFYCNCFLVLVLVGIIGVIVLGLFLYFLVLDLVLM